MRYNVYTDGSGSDIRKVIGLAYIILTDYTYISCGCKSVKGIDNPTYAETVAVGIASQQLLNKCNITEGDEVVFHIDCLSTIDYCTDLCINNPESPVCGIALIKASITMVRELCKVCKVSFVKVEAHKLKRNPNTLVDKMAKFCIRR